jgi:hypothetical protein
MADAGKSHLTIGALMEKRGHGRPCGSKNKASVGAALASLSVPVKRCPGRPARSKNKPKVVQVPHLLIFLLLGSILFSASLAHSAVRFNAYH